MPTQVRGADGRIIHDQLSDADAVDLARRVHEAEGEVVTLVPFTFDGEDWVLDEESARTFGAPVEEVVEDESFPETETAPEPKPKRARRAK